MDHDPSIAAALPEPHQAPPLECPRCRYDLSGMPPTWTDRCPVEGQCSECGLVFPWRGIYDPMHNIPGWSFEHAPRKKKRRLIFALFGTLFRSLLPWKFWRTVELRWPVRKKRLAVYGLLLGAFVLYSGPLMIDVASSLRFYISHRGHLVIMANPVHLWYGPYSFPEWWLRQFGDHPSDPITRHHFIHAVIYCAFFPLQYTPVMHDSGLASSLYGPGVYRMRPGGMHYGPVASMSGWTIMLAFFTAIGYFLPVATLARAKIRRAHQLRAAVYVTLAVCTTSILASVIGSLLYFFDYDIRYWFASIRGQSPWSIHPFDLDEHRGLLWFFWPALLFVHWWCVGRWYYRIPRPAIVSATITGIATAITLLITIGLLGDIEAFAFILP